MPLNNYLSKCEKFQKIIVSQDKGKPQKHIAYNNDKNEVYQYQIDGYIITDGLRCDYLLWNETKQHIYYIELKGSDIKHAFNQIETTENFLNDCFSSEIKKIKNISYRIVLNRLYPTRLYSHHEKKFRNLHSGDLKYNSKIIEDFL